MMMKRVLIWTASVAGLFCCFLVSPAWDWVSFRLHQVEPFTVLQFFGDSMKSRPTYTLFFEGQTRLAQLKMNGGKMQIVRRDVRSVAVNGEGTLEYAGHSICFSSGKVSVDGSTLQPKPPYAVISESGKISAGAMIRTFD